MTMRSKLAMGSSARSLHLPTRRGTSLWLGVDQGRPGGAAGGLPLDPGLLQLLAVVGQHGLPLRAGEAPGFGALGFAGLAGHAAGDALGLPLRAPGGALGLEPHAALM